jgi:hypothetical protein
MTVERNVGGLRDNAARKRQEAFDKVEQGIRQLVKEKQVINFNTVAKASGVSKAWLYKEPEIKSRIEHLRENHVHSKEIPPKQKTSDASKDAIVKTLRERIKKVEAENADLRKQNEVIYGRILQIPELQQRMERLEAENTRLYRELEACVTQSPLSSVPKESNITPLSTKRSKIEISDAIRDELEALNIKITSTLSSKIRNSTEQIVLTAIEALKEQLQHQVIKSPGGWLASAIEDGWQPNTPLGEDREEQPHLADIFGKWYDLARELGIAKGSRKDDDDSIWILESTGQWTSFEEMSAKWKIDYLESRMKK